MGDMWDFGRAELLEPEAIGEPGQRRFRLRVQSGSEAASLWMEKEQLAALSMGIRQILEQNTGDEADEPDPPPPTNDFPEQPRADFQIGRMGVGYDEEKRMLVIVAHEQGEAEDASPTFICQASRSQCQAFAERAEAVISAGRPVCLLCGLAIDAEGHPCLRRNGHAQQPVALE